MRGSPSLIAWSWRLSARPSSPCSSASWAWSRTTRGQAGRRLAISARQLAGRAEPRGDPRAAQRDQTGGLRVAPERAFFPLDPPASSTDRFHSRPASERSPSRRKASPTPFKRSACSLGVNWSRFSVSFARSRCALSPPRRASNPARASGVPHGRPDAAPPHPGEARPIPGCLDTKQARSESSRSPPPWAAWRKLPPEGSGRPRAGPAQARTCVSRP